jgi:hypothetical protein
MWSTVMPQSSSIKMSVAIPVATGWSPNHSAKPVIRSSPPQNARRTFYSWEGGNRWLVTGKRPPGRSSQAPDDGIILVMDVHFNYAASRPVRRATSLGANPFGDATDLVNYAATELPP